MNNYPLGAEHDSNAPFNREEQPIETQTINLFDFLIEQDLPNEAVELLKNYIVYLKNAQHILKDLAINEQDTEKQANLFLVKRILTQPKITIEL
jgi:hypothetical protein